MGAHRPIPSTGPARKTPPDLPRVAILCHDLSSNALGRSLVLADLLRDATEVEILGVSSRREIWAPARGGPVPIVRGPVVQHTRDVRNARRWLESACRADLLLVSKAMPTSLGLALDADLGSRQLALDIDDWEYGLCLEDSSAVGNRLRLLAGPVMAHRPNHASRIHKLERRVPEVAHRLVSNSWLQERFGGTVLYHVRDPERLDPSRLSTVQCRARLGLDDRCFVGFVGTWRPHKGVDDLIEALADLRGPDAPGLLLLGVDVADPRVAADIAAAREALGADRLRVAGPFPMADLPAHVMAADIFVIPSHAGPASDGQIPAKLFDAMALARPIVATAVNDIPTILSGCGEVVPPGNPPALRDAIAGLAADHDRRASLGVAARERLIERFSYPVGRDVLREFVRGAVS